MSSFVCLLMLLLAVSRVQVTPVPYSGEEQVPGIEEEQVPDIGEEQVPDSGEEQVPDIGDEQVPDSGEEQVPDIGDEQVPDSGEEQVPDSGEEQVPDSGDEQVPGSGDELDETQTEDISSRILAQNNNSADFFLEGDLLPPKTRNAMKCWNKACRWPKGQDGKVSVAYTVSSEFRGNEKQLITTALREIESKTCIRFVPRRSQRDFISVENKSGCFAALGKTGGRQVVSLNRRGCVYKGIIQHEFLHALGFKHEQTRSDRDKYVRINWANMDQNMAYNFKKADTNNLNTPYDYNSIMHYGRTTFSRNGRETITPLSRANIGQRQGMSKWDIQRIKLLYSC